MREGRIFLRRSNVSRGNKTTVQLQNLLQPHRMTLPAKCLWQQQLFISDSYRFPNWLPMFTSLHPPVLTQTQQNGSKKLTWLCQVLHVQSFLGCFFLPFHFPFNFGWFHQPSSTINPQHVWHVVPCQCAVHVGGIAMLPHHDEGHRTL